MLFSRLLFVNANVWVVVQRMVYTMSAFMKIEEFLYLPELMISISWFIVCIIKGNSKNILWKHAGVPGSAATYSYRIFSSTWTYILG